MKKQWQVLLGKKLLAALMRDSAEIKLPWYRRMFKGRPGLTAVSRSKYQLHQGDQECARRLSQIGRGTLQR